MVSIDMTPAHLHHANARIGEMVHGPVQYVGRGDEVGIQDEDVFVFG